MTTPWFDKSVGFHLTRSDRSTNCNLYPRLVSNQSSLYTYAVLFSPRTVAWIYWIMLPSQLDQLVTKEAAANRAKLVSKSASQSVSRSCVCFSNQSSNFLKPGFLAFLAEVSVFSQPSILLTHSLNQLASQPASQPVMDS